MLVVGGSKHNQVKVYRLHPNTGFKVMAELAQYDSKVLDVDWAPSMGRSYHLIATATADGHVRIYKFWSEPSLAETLLSDSMFVREGDDLEGSDADVDTALLGDDDEDDEDDEDSASVDDGDDDDDDDEDDEDDADDEEGDDYNYAANGNTGGSNDGHSDDEGAGTGDSDGGSGKRARGGRRTGAGAGRGASTTRAPCFELVVDLSVQPSVPIRRVKWNSAGTSLISCSDDGVTRIWKATVKGTWREVMAIAAEKSAAAEA
ncbi:epoxide hydrolase, soluble (sEH) [Coemansia spiralis]|nr:epoxide hydrolase, soluble (sEH) [Coemansia spiralis]